MKTIRLTSHGPVTTVSLNRPEARNAFDEIAIAELTDVFSTFDDAVRTVILTGEGPVFCAGADINWMKKSVRYGVEENERDALALARMLRAIDECPPPVIARVNGHCLGGGMGLIGACDIVVAVDAALFGYTEVRLGIVPAIISPFTLPKIGARFARRYYLTGERFSAEIAERIGLVHEVVSADGLDVTVNGIVKEILKGGPIAVRTGKTLIRNLLALDREGAERHSVQAIAQLRASPEGQEGLAAFLEKRKPHWIDGGDTGASRF